MVTVICVSAFGPYIAGSVRTEQAVAYLLALIAVPALWSLQRTMWTYLCPWILIVLFASVATLDTAPLPLSWQAGSLLAGLDNYLLPIAIMVVIGVFVRRERAAAALYIAARVIAWASAFNAVLALLQSQGQASNMLELFWTGDADSGSVARLAEEMGRYSGVFNQPAEAGLVYSLGIILAVWSLAEQRGRLFLCAGLILVGGILTVSKVFLFVGVPISIWIVVRHYRISDKLAIISALLGSASFAVLLGLSDYWLGYSYFTRLFELPGTDALSFYTAGRWNEGSSLRNVLSTVLENSPTIGYGFAGLNVPYDSTWTEVLVISGVFGLLCTIAIFALFFHQALTTQQEQHRVLTLALATCVLGASFGITALTANRASTLVWLLISLLLLARADEVKCSRLASGPDASQGALRRAPAEDGV